MLCSVHAADPTVLPTWDFERPGDLEGWRPNAHLDQVTVADGVLHCRGSGSDPILELGAPLAIHASPWQFLEVRLRANRDGAGEWFWSRTSEGRYGGFAQDKSTRFQVRGDESWHVWRVFPFWQAEETIVRLRFDLYDAAEFAVDAIRIGELPMPPRAAVPEFDFARAAHGWQATEGCSMEPGVAGLRLGSGQPGCFLLGPPVRFAAHERNVLSLRLVAPRGGHAALLFATAESHGMHRHAFPLEASAEEITYNLDLLAARDWNGTVVALGFEPGGPESENIEVRSLKILAGPEGPPQVRIKSFGVEEAVPRVGRATAFEASVVNTGATAVSNLTASVRIERAGSVVTNLPTSRVIPRLGFEEEASFRWNFVAEAAQLHRATLEIAAAEVPTLTASSDISVAPSLGLPQARTVPEPVPVRGRYEVGAYYFPGWKTAGAWQPIRGFPERRPVLGWYEEGAPEIADWHIKWAVEHGLTFFVYDWYWSQGMRQLEHGLHDGYLKSRFRHLLKFCLLWANHNAPGTHSFEDCLAVTRYWIANYFQLPEHLTLDGKPVVIIFSPQRLTEDLGSEGVRRALDAMRAVCREAGLAGFELIACVGDVGQARVAAQEGYDAVTAYTWPGLGMTGNGPFAPYADLLEGYRQQWEQLVDLGELPLLPPVCGGWDSRPWHGANNLVRYGRTPALFRRHLQDVKEFMDSHVVLSDRLRGQEAVRSAGFSPQGRPCGGVASCGLKSALLGGGSAQPRPTEVLPLVLVEAWNEWGEGSYIEPHREFGFGYLDALREVFTAAGDHLDVTPADVGLALREVPAEPPGRTAWTFDESDEGWSGAMNLTESHAADGIISARTAGSDPAFFSPPLQAVAADFSGIEVRMRLGTDAGQVFEDRAQLFWRTRQLPESEATSVRFTVRADGAWHDYRVSLAGNPRWRGVVTRLRLDPGSRPGVEVALDSVRLVP